MNGYSNNGFTQSLNGILSLTDGLGTTIENGEIKTGDIIGDDITSNTVTTTSLKSTDVELSGNLTVDNNLIVYSNANISGDANITNLKTNNIDIKSGNNVVNLYENATEINIGDNYTTITIIKAYLQCNELAVFQKGIQCDDTSSFTGINNGSTVDASSLFSAASTIFDGGVIIKKNIYATDVMSNNLVSGNIGCSNLNSSNNITCIKLKSNSIDCNSIITNDLFYKGKICCNINLGISPYLSIPLTTSIYDTTTAITNFNLQTYLINSNNNSLFIQPYYSIIFYNNNYVLQIIDNSSGSNMLYSSITFNLVLTCTKIILQYKNINI